jgi:hypothetical protein
MESIEDNTPPYFRLADTERDISQGHGHQRMRLIPRCSHNFRKQNTGGYRNTYGFDRKNNPEQRALYRNQPKRNQWILDTREMGALLAQTGDPPIVCARDKDKSLRRGWIRVYRRSRRQLLLDPLALPYYGLPCHREVEQLYLARYLEYDLIAVSSSGLPDQSEQTKRNSHM